MLDKKGYKGIKNSLLDVKVKNNRQVDFHDIIDILKTMGIPEEDQESVLEELSKSLEEKGIVVLFPENNGRPEIMEDKDILDGVNLEDPVRVYLKEIASIPLLSAEEDCSCVLIPHCIVDVCSSF